MKASLPAFALAFVAMAGLSAAPTIGTTAATPAAIAAGQPATVTVTAAIADPSLITTGINLLRINSTGSPTILGQLHDDGLAGDAVAGDKIFTLQVIFTEQTTGQIQLQVSAAFKGVLQRVLSVLVRVTVAIPPSITSSVSPKPNVAGWNNSDVTVSFLCADSVGISSCTPPVTVSKEGAHQMITGTATNTLGLSATASVSVSLDKTPPGTMIASPSAGAALFAPQTTVSGTISELLSGLASVTCNGATAVVNALGFSCSLTLAPPANITVQATDIAGNVSSNTIGVNLLPAPLVTFTSPANLSFVGTTPITVRGAVSDPAATLTVNGIAAFASGGTFSVTVPLSEGSNTLTALARSAAGNVGTASVTVTLDTTPPQVSIASPANNGITTDSTLTVTGTVNDIVVGTVNDQDAQVTVNGIGAQVANRTFSAANVPLVLGVNTIQAMARDRVGNGATTSITVTRISSTQPPQPAVGQAVISQSLSIVSGNNQTAGIGTALPAPLVVALRDSLGTPVANKAVVFKVSGGDGTLGGAPAVAVNTDSNGQGRVVWTLGQRSGAGINGVQASSALAIAPVNFAATGLTGAPAKIVIDSGDGQTGAVNQPLAFPMVAVVTDAGNNRVPNLPVTFSAVLGGGNLQGVPSQIVNTDSDGRALAVVTLGPQAGFNNNVVEATFPGNTGAVAGFTASAKVPGNPAATAISGTVFDNSNTPIQGVSMRLYQTNQGNLNNLPAQIGTPVTTDAQGGFTIAPAPAGFFKLMADGSTAVGNKSYPTLEYDIVTVPGQNNTLGTPIFLPALDNVTKLCIDTTHGGTLTLPQSPGFSLTVLPGSATFPGGSRQGCISVTPVHGDKVPMPPGFGQQPRFIVTIQPVGTTFNPPAAITLPNVDGLPPRHVTEMYSYDHDLSMFVAIGTGTVSADGSLIVSNPGVGVLKAGWHCGGDPNASGHVADCPACNICKGSGCVPDSGQAGKSCQDDDPSFVESGVSVKVDPSCSGACSSGQCNASQEGFSMAKVHIALQDAFDKIFNSTCIGPTLRLQMQQKLRQNGLSVSCDKSVAANRCAYVPSIGETPFF